MLGNEAHLIALRQYFPKQSPLDTVSQHELDLAISEMNHRPRKSLNYKTPWEVFFEMSGRYFDSFPSVALIILIFREPQKNLQTQLKCNLDQAQ